MYQTSKVRMKKILGRHGLDKALDDCIDDDFPSIGLYIKRRSITSKAYIYPMISQSLYSKERSVVSSKAK